MAQPNTYATAIEIFRAELAENLFQNNPFLNFCRDWTSSAKGKKANWNESGSGTKVIFNMTGATPPATPRVDVRREFDLDEVKTLPEVIEWTEEYVLNYDKRGSMLNNHLMLAKERVAFRILFRWGAAGKDIVRSTGTDRASNLPAATGTRKRVVLDDFVNARVKLDNDNVPEEGRIAVVPSAFYGDLIKIPEFISKDFRNKDVITTGSIGTILGFDVFSISKGVVFSNAATPNALNPQADDNADLRTPQPTDNASIQLYHPDFVVKAASNGESKVSIIDVHYGTEMSTVGVLGGSSYYQDGRGIVNIVEGV